MGKMTKVAIMYDFDQTLSKKDQQEYSFIPALGMKSSEFWAMSDQLARNNNMDRILAYMLLMLQEAKKKEMPITKKTLQAYGSAVEFLPGVETWFSRINAYGKAHNMKIEHYILSSGLKEMMEGTKIAKNFKRIFACEYHYDENGQADWPCQVVNYTTKTQYLFRISKGALDLYDDSLVNAAIDHDKRTIPYSNMIYIGDGMTDVPCMKLVRERGGYAIALYNRSNVTKMQKLIKDNRVDFACHANYSEGSSLEDSVKKLIDKMDIEAALRKRLETQLKKIKKKEELPNEQSNG